MTFDTDSLILVDYTVMIKEDNILFSTTSESIAREHNVYDIDKRYVPSLVSINNPAYPQRKKINDALAQSSVGDTLTVELAPQDAFGDRDPNKVRVIPLRKLGDDADKIFVGAQVKVDDKEGVVRLISSGRVRIDFNHKFAGKSLVYDMTIVQSLDTLDLKITEIIKNTFAIENDLIDYKLDDDNLTIAIPSKMFLDVDLSRFKNIVKDDIFEFIPTIKAVVFTETYRNEDFEADFVPETTYTQSETPYPSITPYTASTDPETSSVDEADPETPTLESTDIFDSSTDTPIIDSESASSDEDKS